MMGYLKKPAIILGIIITTAIGYFIFTVITTFLENKDFESKKEILQAHLDKSFWTNNNLIMDEERLWNRPNPSFPGFLKLYEYTFLIRNKSTIDISAITVKFNIFNADGEAYLQKKVRLNIFLKAKSIKPIERSLIDKEFEAIPQGFQWATSIEKAEPYDDYVMDHSAKEITNFITSDSLRPNGPEIDWERFEDSVDWKQFERSLDSL